MFIGAKARSRTDYTKGWGEYAESFFDTESIGSVQVDMTGSEAISYDGFVRITLMAQSLFVNPNGGTWNGSTSSSISTMDVGATKTIANPTRTGYNFTGWTVTPNNVGSSISGTTFTMGSADTTLTANWTPAQYTVTVNKGMGIGTVTGAGTYTYGQQVTVTATPNTNTAQYTYGWSNWTGSGIAGSNNRSYTFTMPAGNVTLTANGTQTTNSYLQTVRIRYQNADGSYGNYSNVINQNYNYGATVSWNTGQISGFDTNTYQSASLTSYQVTGAKTTDIDINRKTYALTVNKGTGIASVTGANTYRVGQAVTINATPATGYVWANWTGTGISGSNNQSYTFTMPTSAVTVTANATLNTYTITYDLVGGTVAGNPANYNVTTETITLRNPTKNGYTFAGWTGSNGETPQLEVTINKGSTGNKNYIANWTKDGYTINYELNGGTVTGNPTTYTIESENITLKNPTKAGYSFIGWTGSNGETPQLEVTINKGSTGNKNYTANWTVRTDTPYTVKHWQENLPTDNNDNAENTNPDDVGATIGRPQERTENYTLIDTEEKTGTTGATVTPETKQYEGFTAPEAKTITILGDGSAVLNYYYTRNQYKLTLRKGKGISEVLATGMEEEGEKTYPYNQKITINAEMYLGYTWDKWEGKGLKNEEGTEKTEIREIKCEFNMPANEVEYEAKATPNENTTYTVKHWTQKLEGTETDYTENSYKLEETEILTGETDSKVSPKTKEYEGYRTPEAEEISVTILGDGSLIVDYYYPRRTDLTYIVKHIDKETGEIIKEQTLENQTYETEIKANEKVEDLENYNYDSLEPETLKIGVGENIINIYYVKEESKVIAHHYIYDEETNNYTTTKLVEDEEIINKIGAEYTTNVSSKIPANYECINDRPEGNTGTITKEEKEVSYYYKLKTPKVESNIESEIITKLERDENGNYIIKAGEEVEYEITYETKIDDYIGKATIEIKAVLPKGTKIDLNKSDLEGGIYDEVTNTITWTKEIENIDTFAHDNTTNNETEDVGAIINRPQEKGTYVNGTYTYETTKNIKIIYAEDYVLKDANLKVTGKTILYYPDNYPIKKDKPLINEETEELEEPEKPEEPEQPNEPEEKQGKVIVEYVDIDEPNSGAYRYEINDILGKEYETEEKEIPYYVLVKNTENTKGEIKEETQVVTYYYRKQNFNIGIEKEIESINLNEEEIEITNKNLAKVEIKSKEVSETNLIVKYNIKVTNKGELEGTAKIQEQIPEGYKLTNIPKDWKQNIDETLETDIELEAGESKTLSITLQWENKEENLGTRISTAKIEETKNPANFKDTNEEDNIGEATIVVGIKTGETVSIIIIGMIIITAIISIYITYSRITYKKGPSIKNIKFLK
ncbi:MAG: hypothetical protein HFJ19_04075 [Clostridia bacterium]|nr:hypothetical protein [Clostridia bacterium]